MTNVELTAIHVALRLARERCQADPGSSHRDMEVTAVANIELLLGEVNRTPRDEWPTLMRNLQDRRWLG